MMIECPSCATAYHVATPAIGAGREVVCPRCAARWFVPGRVDADPHAPAVTIAARDPIATRPVHAHPGPAGRRASRSRAPIAALLAGLAGLTALPVAGAVLRTHGFPPFAGRPALLVEDLTGTRPFAETTGSVAVRGTISNPAPAKAAVPDLAVAVLDGEGTEIFRWRVSPPVASLPAGGTTTFAVDLPRVPAGGHAVTVRFAAR